MLSSIHHPDFDIFYFNDRNPVFILTLQRVISKSVNRIGSSLGDEKIDRRILSWYDFDDNAEDDDDGEAFGTTPGD